jgi:hypothetical protein
MEVEDVPAPSAPAADPPAIRVAADGDVQMAEAAPAPAEAPPALAAGAAEAGAPHGAAGHAAVPSPNPNLDFYDTMALAAAFELQAERAAAWPTNVPIHAGSTTNLSMRRILVDWMFELGYTWKMAHTGIHAAVGYLDALLGAVPTLVAEFQCVGAACVLMAT